MDRRSDLKLKGIAAAVLFTLVAGAAIVWLSKKLTPTPQAQPETAAQPVEKADGPLEFPDDEREEAPNNREEAAQKVAADAEKELQNLPQRDRSEWLKLVEQVFAKARAFSDERLIVDDFKGASLIYESLKKSAFPEMRQLAQKGLDELSAYRARLAAEVAPTRRDLVVKYYAAISPELSGRDYPKAICKIEGLKGSAEFKGLRRVMERDAANLKMLADFMTGARSGLASRIGTTIEILFRGGESVKGAVKSVSDAGVELSSGKRIAYADISAAFLASFADKSDPLAAAWMLLYDLDLASCLRELVSVQEKFPKDAKMAVRIAEIYEFVELLREPVAVKAVEDAAAKIEKSRAAGKDEEAAQLLADLKSIYEGTEAFERAKDRLAPPARPDARQGPAKPPAAFMPGASPKEKISRISEIGSRKSDRKAAAEIAPALADPSPEVRVHAAKTLADLGDRVDRDSIWKLCRLLDDPSASIGMTAAEGLERLGKDRVVSVVRMKISSKDPAERHVAALALSMMGTEEAVPSLVRLLRDSSTRVVKTSILGLCRCNAKGTAATILSVLSKNRDREVALAVSAAMGVFRYSPAAGQLLKIVRDNPTWKDRGQIMKAVSEIATAELTGELKKTLVDPDALVRFFAAEALGRLGAGQTMRAKELSPLATDGMWQTRAAAAQMAAQSIDPEAVKLVIELMGDSNDTVGQIAAVTLANHRDGKGAVAEIIRELGKLSDRAFVKACEYLKEATGQDFGSDPSKKSEIARKHESWWLNNAGRFRLPEGGK